MSKNKLLETSSHFDKLDETCSKKSEAIFLALKNDNPKPDDLSYILGSMGMSFVVNAVNLLPQDERKIALDSLIDEIVSNVKIPKRSIIVSEKIQ